MKTEEIIKTTYFKKVLELIKSAIPEIIYPNEPESLAVKICQLVSPVPDLKSAKDNPDRSTEPVNHLEIQEYTSDDYLKLEKETLVKLLMNCQKLLYGNQHATLNNHVESTVQSVKGEGERTDDINQVEKFAQILGRHALENKCFYTSNERHTCYDAFKEWLQEYAGQSEGKDVCKHERAYPFHDTEKCRYCPDCETVILT